MEVQIALSTATRSLALSLIHIYMCIRDSIVSTQIKNDEVILKGEIPARCIQEYRNDLTYCTNGQGVCLTELKGYQPATGKLICQLHRPNSRIDKVRHMFH